MTFQKAYDAMGDLMESSADGLNIYQAGKLERNIRRAILNLNKAQDVAMLSPVHRAERIAALNKKSALVAVEEAIAIV